jgi:glutamate 5-kinase
VGQVTPENGAVVRPAEGVRRLVVKIGSSTLAQPSGLLNQAAIARLVEQVAALHAAGLDVVIVTSAAVAAGTGRLGNLRHRRDIPAKQMLAAIGQPLLMHTYDAVFRHHGIVVAQALLTRRDLAERQGYLNARSTLLGLLQQRVVPIVNENDVVATDELRFGENDNLSAVVANLVDADLLLLLTDIDGLYTADPRTDPEARFIEQISHVEAIEQRLTVMDSTALSLCMDNGLPIHVFNMDDERNIDRIVSGERVGTVVRSG